MTDADKFVSPLRLFRRNDNGQLATPEQVQADGVGGAGVCRKGDPIPPGPLRDEVKQLLESLGLPEEAAVPREDPEEADASEGRDDKDDSGGEPEEKPKPKRRSLRRRRTTK